MKLRAIFTLARAAYVLVSEIIAEAKHERRRAKASRAATEAAMTKAKAHQTAQEKAAMAHKVMPTLSRKGSAGR